MFVHRAAHLQVLLLWYICSKNRPSVISDTLFEPSSNTCNSLLTWSEKTRFFIYAGSKPETSAGLIGLLVEHFKCIALPLARFPGVSINGLQAGFFQCITETYPFPQKYRDI